MTEKAKEYKGHIIAPGITMPNYDIYEYEIFESREQYERGEPVHTAESEGEAERWVDGQLELEGEVYERYSIHGPERERLVKQYGTWAVGRAESVCPEDDVACVEREASRLLGAYRGAFTGPAEYLLIAETGDTVFAAGSVVSREAFEAENRRVQDLGLRPAVGR